MTDSGPTYDVYRAIPYLRPLGRMPRWLTWAIGPALFGLVAGVCALQDTLWFNGVPDLNDLGALIGVSTSSITRSTLPFTRDWCSMILIVTIGLSVVCARYQWDALKTCLRRLDATGAWKWPADRWREPPSGLKPLAGVHPSSATDARDYLIRVADALSKSSERETGLILIGALIVVGAFSYLQSRWHIFAVLAPAHPLPSGSGFAIKTYRRWWASWHHPAGALLYCLIAYGAIVIIAAQSRSSMNAIRVLRLARRLATFDADWLNRDGAYGWDPLRGVFRAAYVSIALRAVQLTTLMMLLNAVRVGWLALVATLWLCFLLTFVGYPYLVFRHKCQEIKSARIALLTSEFSARGLDLTKPSDEARALVDEIARVRAASLNPLRLASWQTSGFVVAVLLPIFLTLVSIFV